MAKTITTEKALELADSLESHDHKAATAIRLLAAERDRLRKLDQEAATYVESVICMRTRFTGDHPYVGWKGLGLALAEELDELETLRAEKAENAATP